MKFASSPTPSVVAKVLFYIGEQPNDETILPQFRKFIPLKTPETTTQEIITVAATNITILRKTSKTNPLFVCCIL